MLDPVSHSSGGPYAINKYAQVMHMETIELDVLDASIGGPADFYMTIVQNWLWSDGRLRVLDPWAIVHRQQIFTNLCKREVLAQMAMHASAIRDLPDGQNQSDPHAEYYADTNIGRPMWIRLGLLRDRVVKYEKRGFVLANDILQLGRRFPKLCKAIETTYPTLVVRPVADESKNRDEIDPLIIRLAGASIDDAD